MGPKSKLLITLLPFIMGLSILYILNQPSHMLTSRQVQSIYYRKHEVPSSDPYDTTLNSDYPLQLTRTTNETYSSENLTYLSVGSKICPLGVVKKLIVLVIIAPRDRETRDTIRQTWGSYKTPGLSYGFLIGGSEEDEVMNSLAYESNLEQDLIIDHSFVDSYDNLTLKSISMVNWASAYCPEAVSILKTDSDMWINVPLLMSKISSLSPGLHGHLYSRAKPIRDKTNKWYVPKDQYRGSYFPNYLSGTAYLLVNRGINLYNRLYEKTLATPYLRMEDIYLTGLVASRAKVKLYNLKGFNFNQVPFTVCGYRKLISSHRISDEEKYLYWQLLQSGAKERCP